MTVVRGNAVKLTVLRLPFSFLISTLDFQCQSLNYFHRTEMSSLGVSIAVCIGISVTSLAIARAAQVLQSN